MKLGSYTNNPDAISRFVYECSNLKLSHCGIPKELNYMTNSEC